MNAPQTPAQLQPQARQRPVPAALLEALSARFGARCSTALAVREQHGRDESAFTNLPPPAAVVYAESTAEVAEVLRLANEHGTPVIPYGVGSSLEGHLLAIEGGISLDVSRMNQVLAIHPEDLTVTVQPGVTRKQLNEELKHLGLFFSVDPGADASIGGMSATRASGTNTVRYGAMRENVLALEVVTPHPEKGSEVIRTGSRAKKSSAGYDLTRLFVGSEGTLGVITEITLKVYPLPEAIMAAVCSFPDIGAAVRTTIEIIQLGVPIARVELLDANTVRAVNKHSKLTLREEPMLLMEFHGSPASVREQADTVQALAADQGGQAFEWAETPEERTRLWTARHAAYFAGLQTRPLPGHHHRRLCADLATGHGRGRERGRGQRGRHPLLPGRPRGRWQLPYGLPDRPGQRGRTGTRRAAEPPAGATRPAPGRHLHRRTRHRPAQDGFSAGRDRHRRGGSDAHDQTRTGPEEHHEPGQDLRAVSRPRRGTARSPRRTVAPGRGQKKKGTGNRHP